MFWVIKGDVFEDHILPDIRLGVAALLEAAGILHIVMEFFDAPSRNDICEGELEIRHFRPEVITKPLLVVACTTRNIPVGGGFPRVYVNLHVVAEAAERRSFGIAPCPPYGEEKEDAKGEECYGLLSLFLQGTNEVKPLSHRKFRSYQKA